MAWNVGAGCSSRHKQLGRHAARASTLRTHSTAARRADNVAGFTVPGETGKGPQALKEWAVACEALQSGDQTIILRKGGIREPTFTPAASQFYLFPTAFHVDSQLVRDEFKERYQQALQFDPKQQAALQLTHYAQVTGAWRTASPQVLAALSQLHVWSDAFLEARLKWRAQQPLTIMELRMYQLVEPVALPLQETFFGCFSWVDLSAAAVPSLPQYGAEPVMSDEQFAARQSLLRAHLKQIQAEVLEV